MRTFKLFILFCFAFAGKLCADTMDSHNQGVVCPNKVPSNVDWKHCAESALVAAAVAMKTWHTWDRTYYFEHDKQEK